jgi:hypothetical protein
MKTVALFAGLMGLASASFGATWTGVLSDSACGVSHAKMMAEHKDAKTDRDCTLACIKGGSQYVFVSKGKVYKLANQSNPEFETHAGHRVEVTGTIAGDTITVSKIDMKKP